MTYRPTRKQISEADLTIIAEWLKHIRVANPTKRKGREQAEPSQTQ